MPSRRHFLGTMVQFAGALWATVSGCGDDEETRPDATLWEPPDAARDGKDPTKPGSDGGGRDASTGDSGKDAEMAHMDAGRDAGTDAGKDAGKDSGQDSAMDDDDAGDMYSDMYTDASGARHRIEHRGPGSPEGSLGAFVKNLSARKYG